MKFLRSSSSPVRLEQPIRAVPTAPSGHPTCRELRRAISFDELSLWYQPIVDLDSGLLSGFEALVRWPHTELGLLGAGAFVPLAEECGLARTLDDWVIRAACKQLVLWQEDVLIGPGFRIAVNVSCAELDGHGLPDRVADAIDATGADPHGLAVELTESCDLADEAGARAGAVALRDMGVELAIDDFGSAYATFSRLRAIPFDVLKLDQSVVADAATPTGEAFVRAAVELAGHLGMRVVAEGVETAAQAALVRTLGCRLGQGHLWSRAVPSAIAERLLVSGAWPTQDASVMGVSATQWQRPEPGSAEDQLRHRSQRLG